MRIEHWIEDLDTDGVDLVGDPANRRPFAIVKNLTGRRPPADPSGERPMKRADLIAKLQKNEAAEIPANELIELLGRDQLGKAIAAGEGGREALLKILGVEPEPGQGGKGEDDATFAEKVAKAVRGLFGGTPDPKAAGRAALLKDATPEARAYIESLEGSVGTLTKQVGELAKARADESKEAIRKRAEALKARGVELDVDKATEVQVAAHEAAQAQIDKALEDLGVTRVRGSSDTGTAGESARAEVEKEIERRIAGRTVSATERSRIKRQVYQDHPGLLAAVRKEERAERAQA